MKTIFVISLLILMCSAMALGQPKNVSKEYFTDTVLVDQDGKQRRLYTDLMEGNGLISAAPAARSPIV